MKQPADDVEMGVPAYLQGEFPDHHLICRLGVGGFSSVYLAEERFPIVREVAIKLIRSEFVGTEALRRFESEKDVLSLFDHPNIARIYSAGKTPVGQPFVVLEFIEGEAITDFAERGCRTLREKMQLIVEVCMAIEYAHQRGVVHRDIKPSNILVGPDGEVALPKVIDFGIAKLTESSPAGQATLTGQVLGTPGYMSPEQLRGDPVDTRTDIFALGALLYELVTLRRLGDADDDVREAMSADLSHLSPTERRRVMTELVWIVTRSVEPDRDERYQSVAELRADLERFIVGEAITARPRSMAYQLRKFAGRNRIPFALSVGLLLTIILASVVSFGLFTREKRTAEDLRESGRELTRRSSSSDFRVANRFIEMGRHTEAVAHLSRAVRTDPSNWQAVSLLLSTLSAREFLPRPLSIVHTGSEVSCAAFVGQGESVLIGCEDGSVQRRNTRSGELIATWNLNGTPVTRIEVDSKGRWAAFATENGEGFVWDLAEGDNQPRILPVTVDDFALAPVTSRLFVVGSANKVVELDPASGMKIREGEFGGRPCGVKCSSDGRVVLVAAYEESDYLEELSGPIGRAYTFKLRFIKSDRDVFNQGKALILLSRFFNDKLHVRVFDSEGARVVDLDERRWHTDDLEALRSALTELWDKDALSDTDKDRIHQLLIAAVGAHDLQRKYMDVVVWRPETDERMRGFRPAEWARLTHWSRSLREVAMYLSPDGKQMATFNDYGCTRYSLSPEDADEWEDSMPSLRLMLVDRADELPDEGRAVVIAALVDGKLRIRIFDEEGTRRDWGERSLAPEWDRDALSKRVATAASRSKSELSPAEKRDLITRSLSISRGREPSGNASKRHYMGISTFAIDGNLSMAAISHVLNRFSVPKVHLIDMSSDKEPLPPIHTSVSRMMFAGDGSKLMTARGGTVEVWRVDARGVTGDAADEESTGWDRSARARSNPLPGQRLGRSWELEGVVSTLAMSEDSTFCVVGSTTGHCEVWELPSDAHSRGRVVEKPPTWSKVPEAATVSWDVNTGRLRDDVGLYGFGLVSVAVPEELRSRGRSTLILARVGEQVRVRIFNGDGKMVIDKTESELLRGPELEEIKAILGREPLPKSYDLPADQRRRLIHNAAVVAGYATEGAGGEDGLIRTFDAVPGVTEAAKSRVDGPMNRLELSWVSRKSRVPIEYGGELEVRDRETGELVALPFTMGHTGLGIVDSLGLDRSGRFFFAHSYRWGTRIWELPVYDASEVPPWLPEVAEAICGYRFDESGSLVPVDKSAFDAPERLLADFSGSSGVVDWLRWLLANEGRRSAYPSTETVDAPGSEILIPGEAEEDAEK